MSLALSLVCVGTSIAFCELIPPADADPLPLRWLRLVAGHPGRSLLAFALVSWALLPRPRP